MKQTETRVCKNCGPTDFQLGSRGYWTCVACLKKAKRKYATSDLERDKRQKDEWYARNRKDVLADLKREREEDPETVKERRAKHYLSRQEHIKNRVITYRDAAKLEVMSHYSNGKPKCKMCGIDDLAKLALDHVNDDGSKHRKEIGGRGGGGRMYLWVRKNGFPPIFQILCHNCNQKKHILGQILAMRANCAFDPRREKQRASRQRLKLEVMAHYSEDMVACKDCGETDLIVLAIDHINGGGAEHRRSLKLNSGYKFHAWLKKNSFPGGFQVLCFNCNMSKEIRRL